MLSLCQTQYAPCVTATASAVNAASIVAHSMPSTLQTGFHMRFRIDWKVFLAALLLVLCFVCTLAYAVAGPRVPWPSISVFYLVDLAAIVIYLLARGVDEEGAGR